METARLKIDDLIPDTRNPRKDLRPGDSEYEALRRSIEEFGYVSPVIINKRNNLVIGGHQRLKVLKELGFDEIDVVYVDLDDEKAEMLLNISLNKISGEFDMEKLSEVIKDIQEDGYDATLTGFSLDDIDGLVGSFDPLAEETEDDSTDSNEDDESEPMVVCPKCQHVAPKDDFKI
ncbi:ParB N-terminal domain-containing protein [Neobacillus sp. C211]|uniref:ParB N-terminal domain-containing protein n=1 Tax=unclassified Neobacillus TaxID=2675272 RepID=UPI003978C53E